MEELKSKIAEGHGIHYNFAKPHEALDGQTPAQRAGINEGDNWLALIEGKLISQAIYDNLTEFEQAHAWLSENKIDLSKKFAGKFLAITRGKQILDADVDAITLIQRLKITWGEVDKLIIEFIPDADSRQNRSTS